MSKLKLYRHVLSGHSHRAELFLSLLGLEAELIDVDLAAGAHKQPSFLSKNVFGQVPVLEDGDITISDSSAILIYLATRYDKSRRWLPADAVAAAEVQRFLSVAAGQLAYGPAAARLVTVFGADLDHAKAIDTAHVLFGALETHLDGRDWLAADHSTLADVALYSYIAHAPEGNISLDSYPQLHAWLLRFETLPGFVPMKSTAVGLAA